MSTATATTFEPITLTGVTVLEPTTLGPGQLATYCDKLTIRLREWGGETVCMLDYTCNPNEFGRLYRTGERIVVMRGDRTELAAYGQSDIQFAAKLDRVRPFVCFDWDGSRG